MKRFLMVLLLAGVSSVAWTSEEIALTAIPCAEIKDKGLDLSTVDVVGLIDLTGQKPRFFLVDLDRGALPAQLTDDMKGICKQTTHDFRSVVQDLSSLKPQTDVRLYHGLGAAVRFYVFCKAVKDAPHPPLKLLADEEERQTEFTRGLLKILEAAGEAKGPGQELVVGAFQGDYRLRNARGVITLKVRVEQAAPAEKPQPPAQSAKEAKAEEPKEGVIAKITTGAPEHLMWFAAVPVTTAKILKFDTGTKTLVPREAPRDLMVGLAWQVGDVLRTDYPKASLSRAFIQGLVKFSKSPGDALGVAVGYRFAPVNVFAGPIWMIEDKAVTTPAASGPATAASDRMKLRWRAGIGVDIASIVGWVKSSTTGKDQSAAQKK